MKRLIVAFACLLLLVSGGLTIYLLHRQKPIAAQPPPQSATAIDNPVTTDKVIADVNKARQDASIAPLTESTYLDTSAAQKCADMAQNGYYAHVNPTTGVHGYQYIIDELPYQGEAIAENINLGSDNEQWMMDSWLASPEHKATILSATYTITGVAKCQMPQYYGEIAVVEHFANVPQSCASICKDTSCSQSTGRGTCSYHGGIAN